MIELPRACVIADEIAEHADFFSFGTNDLTQTTFGLSRDDAAHFLPAYLQQGRARGDPFVTLDQEGVGRADAHRRRQGAQRRSAASRSASAASTAASRRSVEFCHREGLDYVSCSPFRVPIARLAAAQAALRERTKEGVSAQ